MKETIIYKDKFIEKPDLNKIQEYLDYCEDSKKEVYKKLAEYSKDVEIQSLQKSFDSVKNNALYVMSDKEKLCDKNFKHYHYEKCKNGNTYWYKLTGTGVGTAIVVKCDKCGEELNITDYDCW